MDPTIALSAAITAVATHLGKSASEHAYNYLKILIKRNYPKTGIFEAMEKLEKMPESKQQQEEVQNKVKSANADKDIEILAANLKLSETIQNSQINRISYLQIIVRVK
jgi:hypothetical protein